MGSLAAWRLQQAGARVHLLHPHVSDVSRTLFWPDGREESLVLRADNRMPVRALVLAVEAPDTEAALAHWRARLCNDVLVLRLQNGVGSVRAESLPADARLFHVVTTDAAWRTGEQIRVV